MKIVIQLSFKPMLYVFLLCAEHKISNFYISMSLVAIHFHYTVWKAKHCVGKLFFLRETRKTFNEKTI